MKTWPIAAVLACFVVAASALGQSTDSTGTARSSRPQFGDYALESMGALGTGCGMSLLPFAGAFVLAFNAGWAGQDQSPAIAAACGGFAVYAVGSSLAANWIGNRRGWSGSFGGSLGLALVPTGLAALCLSTGEGGVQLVGVFLGALFTPVMAAVGYNAEATRREPRSWNSRFQPPRFAATLEGSHAAGGCRSLVMDARLLTVRF